MGPEKGLKLFFGQRALGVKRLIDLAILIPGEKTPAVSRFPIRVEGAAGFSPRTAVEAYEDWQSHFVRYTHVRFVELDSSCVDRKALRSLAGYKCEVGVVKGNAYRTVARAATEMIDKLLELSANRIISLLSA